jgi:shikimate kinase
MSGRPGPAISRTVFLAGFSGSGKSTVGPLLARRLGVQFYDLDQLIILRSGLTIEEIFTAKGERFFRALEHETLTKLAGRSRVPSVIALGGGVLARASNRTLVQRCGVVVYLSCSIAELYRRLKDRRDRPMLFVTEDPKGGQRRLLLERIRTLLAARRLQYESAAVRVSTTDRTPLATVRLIAEKLRRLDD